MKNTIKLVRGCVCGSLTYNDEEEVQMTDSRREEVLETIKTILGPRDLNFLLRYLAEEYGEYECDSEPCECCGDYVSEWTFKW